MRYRFSLILLASALLLGATPPSSVDLSVEQRQLLVEWNATEAAYPSGTCVHELFEAQVAQTPDRIALVVGKEQVSYQALNARANQLAHYLRGLGVGPQVRPGMAAGIPVGTPVATGIPVGTPIGGGLGVGPQVNANGSAAGSIGINSPLGNLTIAGGANGSVSAGVPATGIPVGTGGMATGIPISASPTLTLAPQGGVTPQAALTWAQTYGGPNLQTQDLMQGMNLYSLFTSGRKMF